MIALIIILPISTLLIVTSSPGVVLPVPGLLLKDVQNVLPAQVQTWHFLPGQNNSKNKTQLDLQTVYSISDLEIILRCLGTRPNGYIYIYILQRYGTIYIIYIFCKGIHTILLKLRKICRNYQ